MGEIVWSDPPAKARSGKYVPFFDALRERPGKWAEAPFGKSLASSVQQGKTPGTSKGEFEVVTRKVEDGGKQVEKVWVRRATGASRDLSAVRAWAAENGIEVSERGRVPNVVLEQFDARK